MKCRECGSERNPNLKHCSSCGQRQISSVEAVDLYLIFWFIVLALLYLVVSTYLPNALGAGFGFYVLIASVDPIIVVAIFMYGGNLVDRIGGGVDS
jgi:hypothetical protein